MVEKRKPASEKIIVSFRCPAPAVKVLDRITDRRRDPLAPSRAQVLELGIALAAAEFEKRPARR